jgi:zona occludens toxin
MLTFITGNPGNGKSLYTVKTIEEMRLKDQREVYQNGIEGLVYPWKALPVERRRDPRARKGEEKHIIVPLWDKVPDGSIVVIDEAWRVFPVRSQGAPVPDFVEWLATHRHHGIDVFLATQQVKTQVDSFVRGLAGKHIHLDRKFGMEYAMKYEWERVADPTSTKDLQIAQTERWMFPKQYYGQYQSAVEHTHKRNLPWKKIVTLVGAVVLAVAAVGGAFSLLRSRTGGVALDSSGRAAGVVSRSPNDFWVRDRVPRVAGVPASAPIYDPLQKVSSQPRPEGCLELAVGASIRCECTGPNRSKLQISVQQCVQLVKYGWFDETRKYADAKAENIAALNGGTKRDQPGEAKSAM